MPRQDSLTVSLGQDAARRKAALASLAEALGFGGNISEMLRWLADTADGASDETVVLLEAAGQIAAGGDEWSTLATVKALLPEITLSVDEED